MTHSSYTSYVRSWNVFHVRLRRSLIDRRLTNDPVEVGQVKAISKAEGFILHFWIAGNDKYRNLKTHRSSDTLMICHDNESDSVP